MSAWNLPPGCSLRDVDPPDPPEFYHQSKPLKVKRGRKCTHCGKIMPPGTEYVKTFEVMDGKATYTLECWGWQMGVHCDAFFDRCQAGCDHDGFKVDEAGHYLYAGGLPTMCDVCHGSGWIAKP